MDAMQRGYEFGAQQREGREKRSRIAELESLAPQVISGDMGATNRAYVLDPTAAGQYQKEGDRQRQQLFGLAKSLKQVEANPQMAAAIYRSAVPFLREHFGAEIPEQYDGPSVTPVVDQVLAVMQNQQALGGGTLQSQKVGDDGFIYNTFRDGRMVNTGVRADRQMWFRDHPGMDPQLVGKDGSVQTVGAGQPAAGIAAQAQQSTRFTAPNGEVIDVSQVQDPHVRQQILQDPGAWGMVPDGSQASLPTRSAQPQMQPQGGSLARPSPAQEAAATERAKLQAQLDFLPQQQTIETQAAIDRAVGIEEGKAHAERARDAEQKLTRVTNDASNMLAMIERVKSSPGREIVTGLSGTLDPRAYLPGGAAADFRANLQQLQGSAFLQAFESLKGGGAITEIEGKKAEQAIAALQTDQSDEGFMRSIATLEQVIRDGVAKAQRDAARLGRSQQSAPPPQQAPRARNPQTGEVVEYRNGQWVKVQ